MKKLAPLILLIFLSANALLNAQSAPLTKNDTLPNFSVKNAGNNRIVIGWVNNLPVVKQISIQRSFDSLQKFITILTVPDPSAIQNGFMDVKAQNDHMFYRLFILKEDGNYVFSPTKKPTKDFIITKPATTYGKDTFVVNNQLVYIKTDTIISEGKPVIVKAQPVVIGLVQRNDSVAVPNPVYNKTRVEAFTPSLHVFTNKDGYVRVSLPDDEKAKKYSIKFFEDNGTFLFELKDMKERDFKLDKTNFYHAGWFRFELYEEGKLLEKHKFYLEKDF
ncbi:MAG: hypothetical protein HOP10_16455 [Chitinophagaceae bacterium]|nr:hypothetical protein [Chitinophagaceae bacterium]